MKNTDTTGCSLRVCNRVSSTAPWFRFSPWDRTALLSAVSICPYIGGGKFKIYTGHYPPNLKMSNKWFSIRLIKNYENSVTLYCIKKMLNYCPADFCETACYQPVTALLVDSWHLDNYQHVQTISSPLVSFKNMKRDIPLKMQMF